jgi:hypothetical protein
MGILRDLIDLADCLGIKPHRKGHRNLRRKEFLISILMICKGYNDK